MFRCVWVCMFVCVIDTWLSFCVSARVIVYVSLSFYLSVINGVVSVCACMRVIASYLYPEMCCASCFFAIVLSTYVSLLLLM